MRFVDTSALVAAIDRDDRHHDAVVRALTEVLRSGTGVTHNYVVVEAEALVHRRFGSAAARDLLERVLPLLDVAWVTPKLHATAVAAHVGELRRRTSLVDHTSFAVMRERGIDEALAIDGHFTAAGFRVTP